MKNHLRILKSYAKGKITLITCIYLSLENVKEKLSMNTEKNKKDSLPICLIAWLKINKDVVCGEK